MQKKYFWSLFALLPIACAIPDISIVDSLDSSGGKSQGGKNQGGTSSTAGKSGSAAGDPGEEPTEGGADSTGGTSSTAGSTGSGGTTSTAGTSPTSGGAATRNAVAKFCNGVIAGEEPIELDLRIGSGSNIAHIVAESGTCSPLVNRACTAIPTGDAVPVNVYALDGSPVYAATLPIVAGQSWIFYLYYDEAINQATLGADTITSMQCSQADFADVFGSEPAP